MNWNYFTNTGSLEHNHNELQLLVIFYCHKKKKIPSPFPNPRLTKISIHSQQKKMVTGGGATSKKSNAPHTPPIQPRLPAYNRLCAAIMIDSPSHSENKSIEPNPHIQRPISPFLQRRRSATSETEHDWNRSVMEEIEHNRWLLLKLKIIERRELRSSKRESE